MKTIDRCCSVYDALETLGIQTHTEEKKKKIRAYAYFPEPCTRASPRTTNGATAATARTEQGQNQNRTSLTKEKEITHL
jgi:hypothetical protein